jgi:AcrR family transcriptional regulator
MSPRLRNTALADDTRARILEVGEGLFRRIGYAKTTVADIAGELEMSPANVYRFFASKAAINEAIALRMLDEMHDMLRRVAAEPASAAERMARLAMAIHRFNKANFTEEKRIHDMVETAMRENWGIVRAHLETVTAIFAGVVRDGMVAGEFAVGDPVEAALTFKQFHSMAFHPVLIAQCADTFTEADVERLTRYALRALHA